MASMAGFDVSGLTERFRTWRPNRFRETTPTDTHVYLPCLSPSATAAMPLSASLSSHPQSPPPDQSSGSGWIIASIEESEEVKHNVAAAQLPTTSPTEALEEPEAPLVNAFISYERENLLALRQSTSVHCPESLSLIAAEIQTLTDERKLRTHESTALEQALIDPSAVSKRGTSMKAALRDSMQSGELLPPPSTLSEHRTATVKLSPLNSQVAPNKTRVIDIINSTLTKSGESLSSRAKRQTEPRLSSGTSQQLHTAKATTAGLSAREEVARREMEEDKYMWHIMADLEAAEAENKAWKKERRAFQKAAKALAALADAKAELRHAELISKTFQEPMSESGEPAQPDSQSTIASAKTVVPSAVPADLDSTVSETEIEKTAKAAARSKDDNSVGSDLFTQLKGELHFGPSAGAADLRTSKPRPVAAARKAPINLPSKASDRPASPPKDPVNSETTGFYCRTCKQEFKSATHLQVHYEMSAAHHVCNVCKTNTNGWKALLLHYKTTGHAIVCKGCCQGNGNAFPADGVAYCSHLDVQNVCKICNLHCGSWDALDEHYNKHSSCQPFIGNRDQGTPYASGASVVPQKHTDPVGQPKQPHYPAPAPSMPQNQAPLYQTLPRPSDSYKKEPPQYQGPPPFGSTQPTNNSQAQIAKSAHSSFNVSFAAPTPLFRAFAGLPKAHSEGTAKYAWLEYFEKDTVPNVINRYQTITSLNCYEKWSLEELRYGDYEKGRKHGPVKVPPPVFTAQDISPAIPVHRQRSGPKASPTPQSYSPPPSHHAGSSCFRCDRQFSTTSGMMSHLESGSCPDGPNVHEFYSTVAKHYGWVKFIDNADRYNMLNGTPWSSYSPFFCPCCRRVFSKLASLISHMEVSNCAQAYTDLISNLLGWIRDKI